MGDATLEFFEKLLELFGEFILEYRQIFWLRDIRPVKQIQEEFTFPDKEGALRKERRENKREEDYDANEEEKEKELHKKGRDKPACPKIFTQLDAFFCNKALNLRFSSGAASCSFFENFEDFSKLLVKSAPFLQISFQPSIFSVRRDGDKLNADIFGVSIMSNKSGAFAYEFWKVNFSSHKLIENSEEQLGVYGECRNSALL